MSDDKEYYYHRAETELKQAQASEIPEAVNAHYELATAYLDLAYSEADEPQQPEDTPA